MANCPDAAQHPGNDYWVNRITGEIQRAGGWVGSTFRFDPGWSGPYDWCAAKDFAGKATGSAVVHSPGNVVGSALGNLGLGSLTSRALWIRIAEGVLGLMLILVAVAELGKGTAVGNVVKKVPFI